MQQDTVGQPGQLVMQRLVLPLQRHRGARVDGGQRQQEEQDQQCRPAHDNDHERGGGQQHEADECLVGQQLAEGHRDGGALVHRHCHAHQQEVHHEVRARGQPDRPELPAGRLPRRERPRVDPGGEQHCPGGAQAERELRGVERGTEQCPPPDHHAEQAHYQAHQRCDRKSPVQKRGEGERHRCVAGILARFPRGDDRPKFADHAEHGNGRKKRLAEKHGKPGGPEGCYRHGKQGTARCRHRRQIDPQR
jgi:hypothetical protein